VKKKGAHRTILSHFLQKSQGLFVTQNMLIPKIGDQSRSHGIKMVNNPRTITNNSGRIVAACAAALVGILDPEAEDAPS
jgi:hypothetical protein